MWEQMVIFRPELDTLLATLWAVYPQEGCGLMSGRDGVVRCVYPVENSLHSPVAFQMDGWQQLQAMLAIESNQEEIVAIYHSHPHGPPDLSEQDLAQATYLEAAQVVVSFAQPHNPTIRAFWLDPGRDGALKTRNCELRIMN